MEYPDLYRKAGRLPKKHAMVHLEEFIGNKKWKENARILDVGCGDGSTNKEVLQKFAPSFRQIVGCDVSKKMIDYAKIHYGNERVHFLVWDVSLKPPQILEGAFDHVFSFFVLHWVQEQEAAFMNIYNTMADGGNCLLVFLAKSDVHDTFLKLSLTEKWREDLMDVGTFISPYFHSQDPGGEVTNLMKKVGFKDVQVEVQKNVYTYESTDVFENLVKAINPFSVLNEKWEDFMTDYFETAPSAQTVHRKVIIAYGAKTVFKNIYSTLTEGGNCLLVFLEHDKVHEYFRSFSRSPKWAEYLKDVDIFMSPYCDSQDAKKEVTNIMEKAGFKDVQVKVLVNSHVYEDAFGFKSLVKAINPFRELDKKWDEFMDDYFETVPEPLRNDYKLIVAYGSK